MTRTASVRQGERPHFEALPPLSLYVHVPWCVRKCPYCDFNSHEIRSGIPEDEYVAAVLADLDTALPHVWGRRVYTVFIGGGTPSVFSGHAIDVLLAGIRARLSLAGEAEVTLEANPGTVEADKFRDFRAAGVTRLSLGIQSFNPRLLKAIGRIHDDREARRAVEIAMTHFDSVNLDLMYALPGETMAEAVADIAAAIDYAPAHISAYHLTIEPNTYFQSYPPPVPDDDVSAGMQLEIEAALAAAGYEHYETSAFAKPGMRSRHNLNYWAFGDYLGIGAGAHSKVSFADRIVRQARFRQPAQYMSAALAGAAVQEEHEVGAADAAFEFMMNALRLTDGFALTLFAERTGLPLTRVLAPLAIAESRGLVDRDHARIAPTLRGQRFLNDLLQIFLDART